MDQSRDQSLDLDLDLYKPRLQVDGIQPGESVVGNSVQDSKVMNGDDCGNIGGVGDSQLVGVPVSMAVDAEVVATKGRDDASAAVKIKVEVKEEVVQSSLVVRKRGRPPRGHAKPPPPPPRQKKDEEDVCFICFDGGTLVLCDRRGCPKAYHPSCIKRDESFFQSKAKWNCGWHICSSCRKSSYYMCYMCPFSLCKGCTKDADYQCVKGNKGLCGTCMKTIMMIEKSSPDGESVQVDFDDKSSWEYLFKVYWVYLKEKLALTVDDLIRAKNPWKGSPDQLCDGSIDKRPGSYNSVRGPKVQRKRRNGQLNSLNNGNKGSQLPASIKWATNELLDFVSHVRNGDTTVLSPSEVQAMLLEYVERNNLRDPEQQSQIVCDLRLINLFGKSCIGHFEMLNLLQSHFIKKESSTINVPSVGADLAIKAVENNGKYDCEPVDDCERKCKIRKKEDESESKQLLNPDGYAAIDVHNISLIYLRRDLVVRLIDNNEKFHSMVIGSIVRIQIPNNDQKDDFHRLVEVVGTSTNSTPYVIGGKTTDVMLDILNLDKKETISIDGISNQEFTEEECRRLQRSMKCGLVKRFRVSEILKKGMVLQTLKFNDRMETEVLGLNHLHNQAREKGSTNEQIECEKKLWFLNSTEERERMLCETLKVQADPTMDPSYESEEDTDESKGRRQGILKRPRNCEFDEKGRELFPPQRGANSNVTGSVIQQNSANTYELSRSNCNSAFLNKEAASLLSDRTGETSRLEREDSGPNSRDIPCSQVSAATPVACDRNNQAVMPEALLPQVSVGVKSSNDVEMEVIWQYQDPTGKVQGPFSMMQLRKWNTVGLFSPDVRVWRITESQVDSIPLINALKGSYEKVSSLWNNSHVLGLGHGNGLRLGGSDNDRGGQRNGAVNSVQFGTELIKSRNSERKNHIAICDAENETMVSTGSSSPADAVNSNQSQAGNPGVGDDSLKDNNKWSHPSLMDLLSSATLALKPLELSPRATESHLAKDKNSPNNEDQNSQTITVGETESQLGRRKRSSSEDCSSQSSGQNWITPHANTAHDWNSNCGFVALVDSIGPSNKIREINLLGLPNTTQNPITRDVEIKQSTSSSFPVQDSGPSWSSALSLVNGQFPDLAGEWGGYSRTTARAVEELDSSLITTSSLKSTEVINDHSTTPSTINWQAIVDEPNDFNSLVDESVSDLLAEVEAMECLSGLASSASMINCNEDLTRDSKSDCFFSVEPFSPTPVIRKIDGLNSTGHLLFPHQARVKDEQL